MHRIDTRALAHTFLYGPENGWGARFGCDARYDDRSFRLSAHDAPEPVLDARTVKAGGKVAAELIGVVDPARGEAVIAYGWEARGCTR